MPLVVGLTIRSALVSIYQEDLPRNLINRKTCPRIFAKLIERNTTPGPKRGHSRESLTDLLILATDYKAIHHVIRGLHGVFDLFGIDLLADGIDTNRISA